MANEYHLQGLTILLIDPAATTVNIGFSDGDEDITSQNFTTAPGRASVCTNLTNRITARGGTPVSCSLDYDSGAQSIEFDIQYTFPEATTEDLITLGFDSLVVFYAGITAAVEPEPTTQCATCNEVTLPACQQMYTFTAGLTADTDYKAVMTGRDGREYIQDVTSDGVGDFSIYMTDAPRGFSTPENSPVQVVVRLTDNGTDQAITVNSVEHPCTSINFVYRTDITPVILTLFINNDFGIALTNDAGEGLEYG